MFMFFLGVFVVKSGVSYMNMDPMKSSFFFILSMLMCMPMLPFSGYVWFSYFICLLFLSGVFVILVMFFPGLSKINLVKSYLVLLSLLMSLFVIKITYNNMLYMVSLNVFYYSIFWVLMIFILFILLFFMNFTSYFLNFSGALRKV
uniref:NADH dehydrogenase subunit 6 n=1 Tax=Cylicodontophorus bicoronatus TaxID=74594 RepID=UPI0010C419A7|nr:NADH dehydrogenase subunit 6 [Cylicodontophorus bicoronatus]